jgi:hypothetical protein
MKDALLELQIIQEMNLIDQNRAFVHKNEKIRRPRGGKYEGCTFPIILFDSMLKAELTPNAQF